MNRILFISFLFAVFASLAAASVEPSPHLNLGKNNVAASGYDVVSYFAESGPTAGSKSIFHEHEGAIYRFSSEANRELFRIEPEKYVPAFGGWCAWAMLEGGKTKINPKSFKIYEGRLFLFYDGIWGDTLKMWNDRVETEAEGSLAATAAEKWDMILEGR